jgi:protein phosphatase 1 regulatory subunit 7
MSEPNDTPRSELDPTTTNTNGTTETRDEDKDDHKPRDSKGWDGKLRVDKLSLSEEPKDPTVEIQSDPEASEDEGPPPEQLPADEDLLDDTPEDEEEIELVHCKISDMSSLRLERFKQMKVTSHCTPRLALRPLTSLNSVSACDKIA